MSRGKKEAVIQVNLRLAGGLHGRLTRTAKQAKRSLNAEMVARLERSFEREHADELLERALSQRMNMLELYNIMAGKLDLPKVPGLLGSLDEIEAGLRRTKK